MKKRVVILMITAIAVLSSCVSKSTHESVIQENSNLKIEIKKLKIELDDLKNGEERLIAKVEKAYSNKNYSEAKKNIRLLETKHPESPKNVTFKSLLLTIKKEEKEDQKRRDAAEKERIRLANINNTGIWEIRHYVDEFGEPTKSKYITTKEYIKGYFSNTATQDSDLNVNFLISNSGDISIKLFEYAGNNPVKAYSPDEYTVLIQDRDKKRSTLKATNYSERLSFGLEDSRKLHKVLLKGGLIKFKIIEIESPTTEYKFTIKNADYYNNAYRIRKGK